MFQDITMLQIQEISSMKKVSIYTGIMTSGYSVGGIIYALTFMGLKRWEYISYINVGLCVVATAFMFIFNVDLFSDLVDEGREDEFKKNLKFIASVNGRLVEYSKEIKTREYKEKISKLFEDKDSNNNFNNKENSTDINGDNETKTERASIKQKPVEKNNNNNNNISNTNNNYGATGDNSFELQDIKIRKDFWDKANIDNKDQKFIEDLKVNGGMNVTLDINIVGNIAENEVIDHNNINFEIRPSSTNKRFNEVMYKKDQDEREKNSGCSNKIQKKSKPSVCDLLKYPSVRYIFIIMNFLFILNNFVYYGLTIGVKNLPGNIYINNILLNCVEVPTYFIVGYMMQIPCLGRKKSLIIYTGLVSVSTLLLYIFFNNEIFSIVTYLIARAFSNGAYVILITFGIESYPKSVGQLAYGINGVFYGLGGIVVSFVEEYIETRNLYLIFFIVSLINTGLLFYPQETFNRNIPNQIKEIEVKRKNNVKKQLKRSAENSDTNNEDEDDNEENTEKISNIENDDNDNDNDNGNEEKIGRKERNEGNDRIN